MRFANQHHGSSIYFCNLSPTLGGMGNVSLIDGDGCQEVNNVTYLEVQQVVWRPRSLPTRFTRCSSVAFTSLGLLAAS